MNKKPFHLLRPHLFAEDVAELLNARPTGPNRWQASCPAHSDQCYHLVIGKNMPDNRLILRCYEGCLFERIIQAIRALDPQGDAPCQR